MSSFGVVVATYGSSHWRGLGRQKIKEANCQDLGAQIICHVHGDTLASARNSAARAVRSDYIIFLDADDSLHPGYIQGMDAVEGDIRYPKIVRDGKPPEFFPPKDLTEGNYIVIGAAVRRDLFLDSGGFEEFEQFEDWALWCKLYLRGATITPAPDAIYCVGPDRPDSRNVNHGTSTEKNIELIKDRMNQWKIDS